MKKLQREIVRNTKLIICWAMGYIKIKTHKV